MSRDNQERPPNILDILRKKRNGDELSREEFEPAVQPPLIRRIIQDK